MARIEKSSHSQHHPVHGKHVKKGSEKWENQISNPTLKHMTSKIAKASKRTFEKLS